MNSDPRSTLLDLYGEWGRLTELEGSAIRDGAWTEVERQQFLKSELRDGILRVIQEWNVRHSPPEAARDQFEREFRPVVAGLIEQECRNQDLLREQRDSIEASLASTSRSASRLRRIHHTYGAPADTRWQSYS